MFFEKKQNRFRFPVSGFRFPVLFVLGIGAFAIPAAEATDTETPTRSATATPSPTESGTPTPSPTETPSPTATETVTPGASPTGLEAACGNQSVYLTWDAPASQVYNVYRGALLLNSSPVSAGAWQDEPVSNLVVYDYSVVRLDGGTNPSEPASIQAEPAAAPVPGGSPAIRVTQSLGANTLSIQAAVASPAGGYPPAFYVVLRSSDGGNSFDGIVTLSGPPPIEHADSAIESGTAYWYSVRVSDGRSPCASEGLYPMVQVAPLDYRLSISRNRINPDLGQAAVVRLALLEASTVRLVVFTPSGLRVRVLADGDYPAGERELTWDGRNDGGSVVAPGVYLLHAEIRGPGGRRALTARVGVLY